MVKIYITLWAAIAALAVLLYATGNFTMVTGVVYGFISFGMIFMGMISVLPATVVHHAPVKKAKVKPVKIKEEKAGRVFHPNALATR